MQISEGNLCPKWYLGTACDSHIHASSAVKHNHRQIQSSCIPIAMPRRCCNKTCLDTRLKGLRNHVLHVLRDSSPAVLTGWCRLDTTEQFSYEFLDWGRFFKVLDPTLRHALRLCKGGLQRLRWLTSIFCVEEPLARTQGRSCGTRKFGYTP